MQRSVMQPIRVQDIDELSRRYRAALMAFFLRRTFSRSDAEDLTQEVFTRLASGETGVVENPSAYLHQIAANLLRDRARREQVSSNYRQSVHGLINPDVENIDPSRIFLARETLGDVSEALRQLPERTRVIFLLFRLEGMKQAELAEYYGISVSAVQKHLFKAATHLTEWMRDRK